MTEITFPTTPEERRTWLPYVHTRALGSQVLAVAQTRIEGAWAAYVDAVPGERHREEWEDVLKDGDKLPENVARAVFGEFEDIPYAE